MEHHSPDQPRSPEYGNETALEDLPESLGFAEPTELANLREAFLAAPTPEETLRLGTEYRASAGEAVGPTAESQVGFEIHLSLLWRSAGDLNRFIEHLDDALQYANQLGLEAEVDVLRRSLRSARARQAGVIE